MTDERNETGAEVYRVVVIADDSGLFAGNLKRYETIAEATAAGRDLFSRWFAVREVAVIPASVQPDRGSYWTAETVTAARVDA